MEKPKPESTKSTSLPLVLNEIIKIVELEALNASSKINEQMTLDLVMPLCKVNSVCLKSDKPNLKD
jgi:hypothetical protein